MPKLKTHKGAAKRFKVTKSGKVKITHMNRRHILTRHDRKYKRGLRKPGYLGSANTPTVKKLLPYA